MARDHGGITNVPEVCNFDLEFAYILIRLEGSVYDERVLDDTSDIKSLKFQRGNMVTQMPIIERRAV